MNEAINSSHASAQILAQERKKIEPRLGYVSNVAMKKDQMKSLGDSFINGSVNQSYDKLIAETLEAKKGNGPNFAQSSKHEGIHSSKNSISFQKGNS